LREVFGDPIRNVISGEYLENRLLTDQQPAVRDVCTNCNNGLSPYDAAGVSLIKQVMPNHDPSGLRISVSREVLGWLIKTHLNYFRVIPDRETRENYIVDQAIKDSLIQHRSVPVSRYRLMIEGWIGESHFWDSDDARQIPWFGYRSVRMRSQRIVISDFRIKTLVTWLIVPSDGDYRRFNERVWLALEDVKREFGFQPLQMIDPKTALQDGFVPLRRVLPLDEVKRFVFERPVPKMSADPRRT
jgi:hypothetical protein